jgi:hypothetical protein
MATGAPTASAGTGTVRGARATKRAGAEARLMRWVPTDTVVERKMARGLTIERRPLWVQSKSQAA